MRYGFCEIVQEAGIVRVLVAMSAFLASGALGLGLAFSQIVSPAPAGDVAAVPVISSAAPVAKPAQQPTSGAAAPATNSFAHGANGSAAQAAAAAALLSAPVAGAGASAAASTVAQSSTAMNTPSMSAPMAAAPMGEGTPPANAANSSGHRFPAYTSANVDGPYIAITFDDGPNPETTPKLLKILEARGIKATFFVVGTRASENPELLRRMAEAGHEIGNHSWNHPQLPKVSVQEADRQISQTSAAIHAAIGKDPIYLRPPYGAMNNTLRKHIEDKFGLAMVYWSADSLDWKNRDTQSIYDKVMAQTRPGGIILMHDIHATTVAAVPRVVDALIAKGYKFVTVSELIAMNRPVPRKEEVASLTPQPARKKPKPQAASASAKPASAASASSAVAPRPASATTKPRPPAAVSTGTSLF
ncbi:polysaccharide deacetylase family protein [Xanthobacter variabilis]|uniref:polysaccharide deacetylase family protein n=1 Tax=Xanthobacter variabilis TaxID=3119932 RepID=UPI00374E4D58